MEDSLPFIDEFNSPDMLHVEIVRADIPRGELISIDSSKLSKEVFHFSAEDIDGKNRIRILHEEMPLLSPGIVNYEGEPLLLLASAKLEKLRYARKQVKFSYETDFSLLAFEPSSEEQIVDSVQLSRGTPKENLDANSRIIEAHYRTSIETHINRAPIGAYTLWEDGRLTVYTPTQWASHVRRTVAETLNIETDEVKVIQTNPSPAYGEKVAFPSVLAAMAALVTQKTGKPARLLLSPQEIRDYTSRKSPVDVNRTSIIDETGAIIAEEVKLKFDMGAYPFFTKEMLRRAVIATGSFYSVPNFSITAEAIRTSAPPMNLYRGLGVAQSLFSTEVHFSRLAEFSELNPGDWKKAHAKSKNIITGAHISSMPLPTLLDQVMEKSDFYRKHSAYELTRKRRNSIVTSRRTLRGIGIASGFTGNGFTEKPESADSWGISAELDKKDQLTIRCGTVTIPEAIKGIWRRKAGEILGISTDSVEVITGDTDTLPDSGPMMLGMPVSVYTTLVERCCNYIRKQRFQKPLPIKVQRNITAPRKSTWDGKKMQGVPFHSLSWGAVVSEVELDPLTLLPEVRGVWASFDCGLVYNTSYAVSIAEGSIYEALAWAMGQEKVTPRYYTDYSLESKQALGIRLPPVSVNFINQSKGVPGGINEIAESLVPAAFVTALSQATGLYFDRIPLTSEIIQSYLEEIA